MVQDSLNDLVALSRDLGCPEHRCSVAGIGSTSARRSGEDAMWIKARGTTLCAAGPDGFVRVSHSRLVAILEAADVSLADTRLGLDDTKIDLEVPAQPTRESLLHAVCLELEGVTFVARTHPTAVNVLTCSQQFEELAQLRLTPDEVALCGGRSLTVPYTSPGIDLARTTRERLRVFVEEHGAYPRVVLIQNNGMLALGATAREVLATTLMAVDSATILAATRAFDGPSPLGEDQIRRIVEAGLRASGPTTRGI